MKLDEGLFLNWLFLDEQQREFATLANQSARRRSIQGAQLAQEYCPYHIGELAVDNRPCYAKLDKPPVFKIRQISFGRDKDGFFFHCRGQAINDEKLSNGTWYSRRVPVELVSGEQLAQQKNPLTGIAD